MRRIQFAGMSSKASRPAYTPSAQDWQVRAYTTKLNTLSKHTQHKKTYLRHYSKDLKRVRLHGSPGGPAEEKSDTRRKKYVSSIFEKLVPSVRVNATGSRSRTFWRHARPRQSHGRTFRSKATMIVFPRRKSAANNSNAQPLVRYKACL